MQCVHPFTRHHLPRSTDGCGTIAWIFELSGGAIADFEDTCLPKEQREAVWTVAALHQWEMGIDDPRCITTAEGWMSEVIKPVSLGGPLPTVCRFIQSRL